MSVSIIKGQKIDITKTNPGLLTLNVGVGWKASSDLDLDLSAFLVGANNKVEDEKDFIFYNNPSGGNASILHKRVDVGNIDSEQIQINLQQVPAHIHKIAFTLTINEGEQRKQSFSQVSNTFIRFINQSDGKEMSRYELGDNFSIETAIVIGELYRYNGEWKFNAIGSGFSGGLTALCNNYGVETETIPAPTLVSNQIPPTTSNSNTSTPMPVPVSPPIKLDKIELKKKGDRINLQKNSGNIGEVLINLNWNQKQPGKRSFFGSSKGVDLDLGCLVEYQDGRKECIQALGGNFGSINRYPYISLDGDDRTGMIATGENMRINGDQLPLFRRILIYAFIYEGVANWAEADGIVTIKQAGGPDIIVRLDEHDSRNIMCAISLIRNERNETFSIEKAVQYFNGHKAMDSAFDFGFKWSAGSK